MMGDRLRRLGAAEPRSMAAGGGRVNPQADPSAFDRKAAKFAKER
jgi:hypothetical protein